MKATLKDLLTVKELDYLKIRNIEESTLIQDLTVLDLFNLMFILDENDRFNKKSSIQSLVIQTLTERALLAQKPIF
jgi:hypothetical protein